MFRAAIQEDDGFARAYGFLSYAQLIAYLQDWKEGGEPEDDDVTLKNVLGNAKLARDKGQGDNNGKGDYDNLWSWAAANVFARNYKVGIAAYKDAIDLADKDKQSIPENLGTLRVEMADALMFQGTQKGIERAIAIVEKELKTGNFRKTHFWTLGWAYYELGYYKKKSEKDLAVKSLQALLQFQRPDALIRKNIIANYSILGLTEAAAKLAKEVIAEGPVGYTVADEKNGPTSMIETNACNAGANI